MMHFEIRQSNNFGQSLFEGLVVFRIMGFFRHLNWKCSQVFFHFAGCMLLGQEEEFVLDNCWPGSECFCLLLE